MAVQQSHNVCPNVRLLCSAEISVSKQNYPVKAISEKLNIKLR